MKMKISKSDLFEDEIRDGYLFHVLIEITWFVSSFREREREVHLMMMNLSNFFDLILRLFYSLNS